MSNPLTRSEGIRFQARMDFVNMCDSCREKDVGLMDLVICNKQNHEHELSLHRKREH